MSHSISSFGSNGLKKITPEPLPGSAGQMLNDNFTAIDTALSSGGSSGYSGYSGKSGYSGYSGYSGRTGNAGAQGTSGLDGSYTLRYSYTGAGQPSTNVPTGYMDTDADPTLSTVLTFNQFDGANNDQSNWLANLKPLGQLVLTFPGEPPTFVYKITGAVSSAPYSGGGSNVYLIPVHFIQLYGDNSGYTSNDATATTYSPPGYSGYSGISGYSGYSGISGYSGYSGKSGYSGTSGKSGLDGCASKYTVVMSGSTDGDTETFDGTYVLNRQSNGTWQGLNSSPGGVGIATLNFTGATTWQILFDDQQVFGGVQETFTVSATNLNCPPITGWAYSSGGLGINGSITVTNNYVGTSGASGYSGKSGYSGYSGISGYSGYSGKSGYSGISGYSGYSGISGYSGYSGISGYSGYSGNATGVVPATPSTIVLRDGSGGVTCGQLIMNGASSTFLQLLPWSGQSAWIDMPATAGLASGLGSGGTGQQAWIAYAGAGGNWFSNSSAGDICYRNLAGRLQFGTSSGNASVRIDTDNVIMGSGTLVCSMDTMTYASTISLDVTKGNTHKTTTVNATGNATINASTAGTAGQFIWILIVNDATSGKVITFGTNFKSTGTLTGTASKSAIVQFVSDGSSWYECSRTTGL